MDFVEQIDALMEEQYQLEQETTEAILAEEDFEKHAEMIDAAEKKKEEIQATIEEANQKQEEAIRLADEKEQEESEQDEEEQEEDEKDPYASMTADEMRKAYKKSVNLAKAKELDLPVKSRMKEIEICELIFEYFNGA